jgi:hypothetical protein
MRAWEAIRQGQPNPLQEWIGQDEFFRSYVPEQQLYTLMDASHYVGDAPHRARALAEMIRNSIAVSIDSGV